MQNWRPTSTPEAAARRAAMLHRLRSFFDARGLLAVDTPALNRAAVSDINIESFAVSGSIADAPLYLHTSPEFHMKRLLAAGYPDIYSIGRVFRDGEAGRQHQPEFTMVEWYRLDFDLDAIIADAIDAIEAALGNSITLLDVVVLDYCAAMESICKVNALHSDIGELAAAAGADARLCDALGDHRDGWLDLLLAQHVIPSFPADRLTVLRHYPGSQAALARRSPRDPDVADRFEVFLGQTEIANGYVELTDAEEQRARIEEDQHTRQQRGLAVRPIDEQLLSALKAGLPPCAGVAMGLERLQMLHDKTDDIRNVVTFAFEET